MRRLDNWAFNASLYPFPKRLLCDIWANNIAFSTELYPAPALKLPVDLSVTFTSRSTISSSLLLFCSKLTSSKKPRLFILSQGDPTESNITADGNFFDFEVAGMNPLAQESAIFCAHSYLSGHYITPKYSESSNPQDRDYTDTFSKQIEVKYEIALDGNLKIDFRYPLPQLKKDLIGQYNNMIVKALEKQLTPEQQAHLVSEFKSAMLLRLIGVKNIFRLEEKDILLYLGLIAHFMQDRKFQSISEYIENKFVAI